MVLQLVVTNQSIKENKNMNCKLPTYRQGARYGQIMNNDYEIKKKQSFVYKKHYGIDTQRTLKLITTCGRADCVEPTHMKLLETVDNLQDNLKAITLRNVQAYVRTLQNKLGVKLAPFDDNARVAIITSLTNNRSFSQTYAATQKQTAITLMWYLINLYQNNEIEIDTKVMEFERTRRFFNSITEMYLEHDNYKNIVEWKQPMIELVERVFSKQAVSNVSITDNANSLLPLLQQVCEELKAKQEKIKALQEELNAERGLKDHVCTEFKMWKLKRQEELHNLLNNFN